MSQRIKLIWDFRGPDAEKIAKHYQVHLDEFADANDLSDYISGIEVISAMYCMAYMEILEEDKDKVVGALKPHRAE